MGGGTVIDPFSPRRGRARPARLAWLDAIEVRGPGWAEAGVPGRRLELGPEGTQARIAEQGVEREPERARTHVSRHKVELGPKPEITHASGQEAERGPERAIVRAIESTETGVDTGWIQRAFGITEAELERMLDAAGAVRVPDTEADRCFSPAHWVSLQDEILAFLGTFHRERPRLQGANANDVRLGLARRVSQSVVEHALAALLNNGAIARRGVAVRLPGHRVTLGTHDERVWPRVARTLDPARGSPPSLRQAAEQLKIDEAELGALLKRATNAGLVLPVTRTRFVPLAAVKTLAAHAESLASTLPDGRFTAAEYKDHARIGRNFAIELLECFDRSGFTERLGDRRRVRRPAAEAFGTENDSDD